MLIAQITDTHIVEENKHWLSEPLTKTDQRLASVVAYINQLSPQPDVVLLTGDATDTGTKESYDHLKELLKPLKALLYVIPGNHDNRDEMRKAFPSYMPKNGFLQYVVDDFPVRLIGLDTHIPGKDSGLICNERFEWLNTLKDDKPALIFMHHPIPKTGNQLFDAMLCAAPSGFGAFVRQRTHLIGMVCGHYHQLCISSYHNKTCFTAPSVAPVHYFERPYDNFVTALELEDPAVTLHHWNGESLVSHVHRIKEDHKRIDWNLIKNKA